MTGTVHSGAGILFGIGGLLLLKQIPDISVLDIEHTEQFAKEIMNTGYTVGDSLEAFAVVCASWFGSLLPDIDHPTSTMSKKYWFLSIPYRILQFIFGKFKATKDFVGHRGITHSLLFMSIPIIAMFFVTNLWVQTVLIGLTVGIFSHLFMDMLNPTGVPLFMPFAKKKFRLLPKKLCIRTR